MLHGLQHIPRLKGVFTLPMAGSPWKINGGFTYRKITHEMENDLNQTSSELCATSVNLQGCFRFYEIPDPGNDQHIPQKGKFGTWSTQKCKNGKGEMMDILVPRAGSMSTV